MKFYRYVFIYFFVFFFMIHNSFANEWKDILQGDTGCEKDYCNLIGQIFQTLDQYKSDLEHSLLYEEPKRSNFNSEYPKFQKTNELLIGYMQSCSRHLWSINAVKKHGYLGYKDTEKDRYLPNILEAISFIIENKITLNTSWDWWRW